VLILFKKAKFNTIDIDIDDTVILMNPTALDTCTTSASSSILLGCSTMVLVADVAGNDDQKWWF
jgi:hypothetical protein